MSKIEVNQISSQCGSTLTIGQSGDTIQLACGATQTGFGRTGTVDWDTTAKTASFTAVSGNGYFVNTTSGAITLTLPASPSAGDIVAFKDYAFTFATNNLTVDGNGSPIGGVDGTILPTYSTNGTSKTFIYVDGTKGWLVTNESTDTSQEINPLYVTATGGTVTCCGDYKIHTFTGPGTFTVTCAGNADGSNSVDYLVVAGGGGGGGASYGGGVGGFRGSGGGGAGGFRVFANTTQNPGFICSPANPLNGPAAIPVTVTSFPITVGGGGAAGSGCTNGTNGANSIFSTITSAGGGGGGLCNSQNLPLNGQTGGSGGGSGADNSGGATGAAGNTPPVSPPQGNPGGDGQPSAPNGGSAGGGGGALAAGSNGSGSNDGTNGGAGGVGGGVRGFGTSGVNCGSDYYFSGGGGGGNYACGGTGGGGKAGRGSPAGSPQDGTAGTANTGGGGGGTGGFSSDGPKTGGAGGSGIVIIRYKYQ
jgi:hypothetical protein